MLIYLNTAREADSFAAQPLPTSRAYKSADLSQGPMTKTMTIIRGDKYFTLLYLSGIFMYRKCRHIADCFGFAVNKVVKLDLKHCVTSREFCNEEK